MVSYEEVMESEKGVYEWVKRIVSSYSPSPFLPLVTVFLEC